MEVDSQEYTIEVCRDWYRQLADQAENDFLAIASFWVTPETFVRQFTKAINHYCVLDVIDEESIKQQFYSDVKASLSAIESGMNALTTHLIDCKKG